jgi:hypothetical protein
MYVLALDDTVQKFPYTLSELRFDNPNVSFPSELSDDLLAQWNVHPVREKTAPTFDFATQNCRMINPALLNGQWTQQWEVTPATSSEIAERTTQQSNGVRSDRNQRLAACDWTQLPDAPVDRPLWASYRQNLRDVTSQPGFPWNITWPIEP